MIGNAAYDVTVSIIPKSACYCSRAFALSASMCLRQVRKPSASQNGVERHGDLGTSG